MCENTNWKSFAGSAISSMPFVTEAAIDDSIYTGEVNASGQRHGIGRYFIAAPGATKGQAYVGQFEADERHGQGVFTWPNGNKYTGEWFHNVKHGNGSFIWPSGEVYSGQWSNDRRAGIGTLNWPNGGKYEGEWTDSKRHGRGVLTFEDGSKEAQISNCGTITSISSGLNRTKIIVYHQLVHLY